MGACACVRARACVRACVCVCVVLCVCCMRTSGHACNTCNTLSEYAYTRTYMRIQNVYYM